MEMTLHSTIWIVESQRVNYPDYKGLDIQPYYFQRQGIYIRDPEKEQEILILFS